MTNSTREGLHGTRLAKCKSDRNRMLEALKVVYRKHHKGDPSIGWHEMDDVVADTLMEVMGDEAFQEFARQRVEGSRYA